MITIDIKESKKFKTKYSGFVSFEYDSNIVNTLRSLPFKFYNPETKVWEIPCDSITTITDRLKNYEIKLTGNLSVIENSNTIEIPDGFEFKTKPFSYQLESFEYGLKYDRWFLGDQMGLGKSKQTIDIAIARKLKYGYKHCLIVCGVNTLKWNWVNEVHTHSNEDAWILGQRTNKKGKTKIGSTKEKLADLVYMNTKGEDLPYFIITNIETFRDKEIADTIKKLVDLNVINMCIADESHKMKNPTASQTKGFLKCLPECRIIMTGTPVMNSPLDLFVILRWLGYENHSFTAFKSHYCVMGGYGGYEVVGYRNMNELTNKVQQIMLRRLKEEVLDLPEKTYVDEYIEMTDRQSLIYKQVEMDIKANIDIVKFDNNPLATLIRLRQATGWTGILSSEIQESAKLDRMYDIVEECVANNEKVIIFSNWTQMTDIIVKKLDKFGVACITGETKDEERQFLVNKFQMSNICTEPCNVLVGTIGAAGTGLTLTAATTVIFVDEPWNRALYDQAVDRAHRIGQKNNITIYNLLCKNSIDERIHNIVYKKGLISDTIIDGKGVMSKEMFEYLLG